MSNVGTNYPTPPSALGGFPMEMENIHTAEDVRVEIGEESKAQDTNERTPLNPELKTHEHNLPHQRATNEKHKGSLPGINLLETSSTASKIDLIKKLRDEGDTIRISLPAPKGQSDNIEYPLTITLELSQPDPGCRLLKKGEHIVVTVKTASGKETKTDAIGGYWIQSGPKVHCVLDHREQRLMDYQLTLPEKDMDPMCSKDCSGEEAPYQAEESTLQVKDFVVPNVTHLEKSAHTDGYYQTHNAVLPDGFSIPTALIEHDFEQWNSTPHAVGRLFRSIAGIISHASKNPGFDTRTICHILAAVGIGTGGFLGGDELSALIQSAAGFPAKSFLGGDITDPTMKKSLTLGFFLSLLTYFGFETTKDAMGVSTQFVSDPAEKRKIATKMALLEVFGGQVITGLVIAASTLTGQKLANGSVPGGEIAKTLINMLVPQTLGNGIATLVQSYLISEKNWPAYKAWFPFLGLRILCYRGLALGTQALTAHFFEEGGITKDKIYSILIANAVNEAVMGAMNGLSYLAGYFKSTDGSEEDLMAYEQDMKKMLAEQLKLAGIDEDTLIQSLEAAGTSIDEMTKLLEDSGLSMEELHRQAKLVGESNTQDQMKNIQELVTQLTRQLEFNTETGEQLATELGAMRTSLAKLTEELEFSALPKGKIAEQLTSMSRFLEMAKVRFVTTRPEGQVVTKAIADSQEKLEDMQATLEGSGAMASDASESLMALRAELDKELATIASGITELGSLEHELLKKKDESAPSAQSMDGTSTQVGEQLESTEKVLTQLVQLFGSADISDQKLEEYAATIGLKVNGLHRFRLNVSRTIDKVDTLPKTAWSKVSNYFMNRNPDSIATRVVTSPFVSALVGESDYSYEQTQKNLESLRKAREQQQPEDAAKASETPLPAELQVPVKAKTPLSEARGEPAVLQETRKALHERVVSAPPSRTWTDTFRSLGRNLIQV